MAKILTFEIPENEYDDFQSFLKDCSAEIHKSLEVIRHEQSEIDRRFNSFKVKPLTDYEGKDLQNFLDTYRPSYELLSKWTDYDLVKYIKQSAIAFDVAGRPAAVALPPLQKDLNLGGN